MRFEFTLHARERCKQRKIRFRDVRLAIKTADRTQVTAAGLIEVSKKIRGKTLIVIFQAQKELRKIITAYYEN